VKLILSSSGSFNKAQSLNNAGNKTIVFTHNPDADIPDSLKVILRKDVPSSVQICNYLYSSGIQSLFIEGGAAVLNHFISTGFWDEARIFTGEIYFKGGVNAPHISGILFSKTVFSGSSLEIYLKNGS
jgi:diaminohydroxyphosphoribosylaminopyrimidine deaminase/5-amino-6-(5-phosphoribosylamino)uracil reductase